MTVGGRGWSLNDQENYHVDAPPFPHPIPPLDSEALNEEGGTMVVFGWVPANDGSKGLKGQDEFLI